MILKQNISQEIEMNKFYINYSSIYNTKIKRLLDLILAIILLIILSPIYIVISLLIVIETGFPIFYKADRGGYNNKTFKIF